MADNAGNLSFFGLRAAHRATVRTYRTIRPHLSERAAEFWDSTWECSGGARSPAG